MMDIVLQIKEKMFPNRSQGALMTDLDYKSGRRYFIAEGCCANGIVTLTTGAFLSGYASSLGATDSINGIIGSLPLLLCLLQMFSAVLLESMSRRKNILTAFSRIHRL